MVRIEAEGTSFCVDVHEVTQEQYRDFIESKPDLDSLYTSEACKGFTDIKPNIYPPAAASLKLPVVEIPFCGAEAYCAFAGKTLCGAVEGGAVRSDLASSPKYGALTRACSGDSMRKYAYGDAYEADFCNGNDYPGGAPLPVASVATCVTPDTGIYDLSGNVWEWIDACDGTAGATDSCYAQGGAFNSPETELSCDAAVHYAQRVTKDPTLGARCCAR
jgi:formylglycine-generating enzyme required for sulfatase activity